MGKTLETPQHNTVNNCVLKMIIEVNQSTGLSYYIVNCHPLYRDFHFFWWVVSVGVLSNHLFCMTQRLTETDEGSFRRYHPQSIQMKSSIQGYTMCNYVWTRANYKMKQMLEINEIESNFTLSVGLYNVNKPHVALSQKSCHYSNISLNTFCFSGKSHFFVLSSVHL